MIPTLEEFLEKGTLEEFSTASTIAGLEEVSSTVELRSEEDLEDGEIPQPPDSRNHGGLSQVELDNLCVTESDVDHRSTSSIEDGELTEDDAGVESEIDFEAQLQDASDPSSGMGLVQKGDSNVDLGERWCWSSHVKDFAAIAPDLASASMCHNRHGFGLEPLCMSSQDEPGRHDCHGLEPLCLSPRAKQHLFQSPPVLTSPRQKTSMLLSSESKTISSRRVLDAASQEQLTKAFFALLSSDSTKIESATSDLLAQLADAVGPHLAPTAQVKQVMHIDCLKQHERKCFKCP
jgi:hypothetical protein